MSEGYKIGQVFQDEPMDLSNYLVLRTKEMLLLQNKVNAPKNVMRNGAHNPLSKKFNETCLKECTKDL